MSLRRFVFSILLWAGAFSFAHAEHIVSFSSDIVIAEDGSMVVEETIRVVAQGKKIKQGIYRDFPTRYKDRHGNRITVAFDVLAVSRDGSSETWHTDRRANGVRLYIGKKGVYLPSGEYTYSIRYQTDRQLGFFEEHDELYWNVTGNGWAFPIMEASSTVNLPGVVPASGLFIEGYTGSVGSTAQHYFADVSQSGARIRSTKPLGVGEGLTLVFSWPKGIVQQPTDAQRVAFFFTDNMSVLLSLLALLGSGSYLFSAWRRYGKDPQAGVVFPHYEPPAGYSPASLRYVQRMGYDNATFTAAVINLAVKGYLKIEEEEKYLGLGREYVLKKTESNEPLAPGEAALVGRLFLSGDTLRLAKENHATVSGAQSKHKNALEKNYRNLYFKTNGKLLLPTLVGCAIASLLAAMLGGVTPLFSAILLVTAVMHMVFLWLMKAPSARGRRLMDKSEGFKLYLEVAEKDDLDLQNPPDMTPQLFESYLPYAYALGVEQQWADKFSAVFAQLEAAEKSRYQPRWYSGDFRANNIAGFSKAVGGGLNSAISSAAKPPGSSSGGGGGGSSGGGGGGGGGGGW